MQVARKEHLVKRISNNQSATGRIFKEFSFSGNPLFSQRNLGSKSKIAEIERKQFLDQTPKLLQRTMIVVQVSIIDLKYILSGDY